MINNLGSMQLTSRLKNIILMLIAFAIVFFGMSYFFMWRNDQIQQAQRLERPLISADILDKPIGEYRLLSAKGIVFDNKEITNGKAILVFMNDKCDFCKEEAKFLEPRIAKHPNIKFIGIMAYGDPRNLENVQLRFPFDLYYNPDGEIVKRMGLRGVPTKLFVSDGYVRKIMDGSTVKQNLEKEFDDWLSTLE